MNLRYTGNNGLAERRLTNCRGVVYSTYLVQGSVRVELIRTGGDNTVLSEVFWDKG
jgi:hypothetical protein